MEIIQFPFHLLLLFKKTCHGTYAIFLEFKSKASEQFPLSHALRFVESQVKQKASHLR